MTQPIKKRNIHIMSVKAGHKQHNEDYIRFDHKRGFYVLADGLTDFDPGSARYACNRLIDELSKVNFKGSDYRVTYPLVDKIISDLNDEMYIESMIRGNPGNMSCTLDLIIDTGYYLMPKHFGDGKILLYKNGEITHLTGESTDNDTDWAQYFKNWSEAPQDRLGVEGDIKQSKIINCPTKAIMYDSFDRIVMMTDGMWDVLTDKHIAEILSYEPKISMRLFQDAHKEISAEMILKFIMHSKKPMDWILNPDKLDAWLLNMDTESGKHLYQLHQELAAHSDFDHKEIFLKYLDDEVSAKSFIYRAKEYCSQRDDATVLMLVRR